MASEDNRTAGLGVTSSEPRDAGAGGVAGVTRNFRAVLLVALLFVIFVGVSVGGALYTNGVETRDRERIEQIQHQQDEDMCRMLAALLPTAAPAPSSSYGAEQRRAVSDYRAHRC